MQMNSKNLKTMRESLAKWHVATHKLADELLQKQSRVRNFQSLINSNLALIKRIEDGDKFVMKSLKDLRAEIEEWESKVDAENKAYANLKKKQEEDLKCGTDLITDDMVKAITDYTSDIYSDKSEVEVLTQLVQFFIRNGADDCKTDDVRVFLKAIGQKKASASQMFKSGKHNTTLSKSAIIDLLLGAICDEPTMQKCLPIYKYNFVVEQKSKKTDK